MKDEINVRAIHELPQRPQRKSIRLKGYDYSQPGAYFVTIVTQNRENLFGEIVDDKMMLNDAGVMIERWYYELPNKFADIECDEYVIMPNHIHFIIQNVGADLRVCPDDINADLRVCPNDTGEEKNAGEHIGSPQQTGSPQRINSPQRIGSPQQVGSPLPKIIQWFKTMTTNEYIRNVKINGWRPFNGKLWQRNYYEHIIRNETELNQIHEYIINNPLKWNLDKENILNQ